MNKKGPLAFVVGMLLYTILVGCIILMGIKPCTSGKSTETELYVGPPTGHEPRPLGWTEFTHGRETKYVTFYSEYEPHQEYIVKLDGHIEIETTTSTIFEWQHDQIRKCRRLGGNPEIDDIRGRTLWCYEF